jgi:WD40 repeat protein
MFLPGGRQFVIVEWWNGKTGSEYGPAFVTRDAKSGKMVSEVQASGQGHSHPYSYATTSPDRRLVVARTGRWLGIYRSDDFAADPVLLQNESKKAFTGIAFHPSGKYLAATSNDETITIYDTTTWAVAFKYNWGIGRLRSIAFSADGMLGAVGGDKGKLFIWDVPFRPPSPGDVY